MKDCKRVKDPIYGYIKIPAIYMTDIVDTAAFQRLRRFLGSPQSFCPFDGGLSSGRANGQSTDKRSAEKDWYAY